MHRVTNISLRRADVYLSGAFEVDPYEEMTGVMQSPRHAYYDDPQMAYASASKARLDTFVLTFVRPDAATGTHTSVPDSQRDSFVTPLLYAAGDDDEAADRRSSNLAIYERPTSFRNLQDTASTHSRSTSADSKSAMNLHYPTRPQNQLAAVNMVSSDIASEHEMKQTSSQPQMRRNPRRNRNSAEFRQEQDAGRVLQPLLADDPVIVPPSYDPAWRGVDESIT